MKLSTKTTISTNNNLNSRKVTPLVHRGYSQIKNSLCVTFDQDCTDGYGKKESLNSSYMREHMSETVKSGPS